MIGTNQMAMVYYVMALKGTLELYDSVTLWQCDW